MSGESKIIREAEAIAADRTKCHLSLFSARPFLTWLALQNALARGGSSDHENPYFLRDLGSRISEERDSSDTVVTFELSYSELERLESIIHHPGSLASPWGFIIPIYRAYVKSGGPRNYGLEKRRRITIDEND